MESGDYSQGTQQTNSGEGSGPSSSMKVCRIRLNESIEGAWTLEKVLDLWEEQEKYIDALESRVRHLGHRRENYLVMRLSTKEREIQDLSAQIRELKRTNGGNLRARKPSLLDPALNLVLSRLKKELEAAKTKMTETQEELSAWKFTPDTVTGKRLMSKCRLLLQENEDIGKMIASGRLSKLEAELAMQKTLAAKMKKNQLEMDEFVQELDEDVEGMQSTIYYLQQQLREAKEKLSSHEKKEEEALKDPPSSATLQTKANEDFPLEEDCRPNPEPSTPRGRGRRNPTASKTESPRRSTRGQKREAEEDDEQASPSKGRPKRRRNAPISQKSHDERDEEAPGQDSEGPNVEPSEDLQRTDNKEEDALTT